MSLTDKPDYSTFPLQRSAIVLQIAAVHDEIQHDAASKCQSTLIDGEEKAEIDA